MDYRRTLATLALIAAATTVTPALAQRPATPEAVPFPEDVERKGPPKSDAYRLVGKVVEVDKAQGTIKLETDEGVRTVKPSPMLLAAARVGDMISVDRGGDAPVNASPRTEPRTERRPRGR